MLPANASKHFKAVQIRHHHIEKHEIEALPTNEFQRAEAAVGLGDIEITTSEPPSEDLAIGSDIVHDQERGFSLGHERPSRRGLWRNVAGRYLPPRRPASATCLELPKPLN